MNQQIEQELALFSRCVERPAEEWDSLLEEVCDDERLRVRVRRLLERHQTIVDQAPPLRLQISDPERIGPYRILQRLGEGGMGIVYAAEQRDPVRRRVAVKVLRTGYNSREVLARFDAERQALALMNHANIARILDAGTTEDRRPYIVMEYVPGKPITEYCAWREVPLQERLCLFRDACDAVQHAHQKGVIHRDLKPSNILVMEEGGQALVKVIDFGIAKAVSQRLTEHTLETKVGSLLGTPDYMSPEQAELTPLDVDTRADVYALGAVLYELLCGTTPLQLGTDPADFSELQRRIREQEPVPPSRQAAFGKRHLRNELDWITLKSLDKDRARRYDSASAFADDITRYLNGEAPRAGPRTFRYQAGRFLRRHAFASAVTSGFVIVALSFTVALALQLRETERQRDRANREAEVARRVTHFTASLFELAAPDARGRQDISVRELLDLGVSKLRRDIAGERPEVRAALLEAAGDAYRDLAVLDEANRLMSEALAIRRQAVDDSAGYVQALVRLARLKRDAGDYEAAAIYAAEALDIVAGDESLGHQRLPVRVEYAQILRRQGKLQEAARLVEHEVTEERIARSLDGARALHVLGRIRATQGRFGEAESLLREALRILLLVKPQVSEDSIDFKNGLTDALVQQGKVAAAEEMLRETIADTRALYGESHPNTGILLGNLALVLTYHDTPEENRRAELAYIEALEILQASLPADHIEIARVHYNLGNLYVSMQSWRQALSSLDRSIAIAGQTVGEHGLNVARAKQAKSVALAGLNRSAEAIRLGREAVIAYAASVGERHWLTASAYAHLAGLLFEEGAYSEADYAASRAVTVFNATLGKDHARTRDAAELLARINVASANAPAAD